MLLLALATVLLAAGARAAEEVKATVSICHKDGETMEQTFCEKDDVVVVKPGVVYTKVPIRGRRLLTNTQFASGTCTTVTYSYKTTIAKGGVVEAFFTLNSHPIVSTTCGPAYSASLNKFLPYVLSISDVYNAKKTACIYVNTYSASETVLVYPSFTACF
jgi:hypothetical protein